MDARRLEGLCKDHVTRRGAAGGIEVLEAWFAGTGYSRHRHDTYAVGVTDSGVQSFWYRGTVHSSTPGDVVVLHPDEVHDGYAGTPDGFGYRIVYVQPAEVIAAVGSLPFVREPVVRNTRLRASIERSFNDEVVPLAAEALVLEIADGLLAASGDAVALKTVDEAAVRRAREFLDAATDRVVHSAELERVSGLSRFDLCRQFRQRIGTSPYRYSLMRRLDRARARITAMPMADVALDAGFADQAHFSRAFKAAYGMPPRRYLSAAAQ